jgi:putative sterol carrier protein
MMLHLAFRSERAVGVDTVFELDLSGPGGGRFTIHVHDGVCDIHMGAGPRPADVVYSMSATTWREMAEGRATGDEALLLGRLNIAGDPTLARKFNDYFQPAGEPAVGLHAVRRAQAPTGLRSPIGLAKKVMKRESAA